ncbi:MAG: YIP1 family protein [Simkaniaceae bacterium]
MDKPLKRNPWFSIWTKPRETIAEIVEFNPRYRFIVLSFIYGLPWMLQFSQTFSLGTSWSMAFIVIICLILAIPVGALAMSFTSLLLLWTGKLLKGGASFIQIRAAVSWTNVPNVVNIIAWIILLLFFQNLILSRGFTMTSFVGFEKGLFIFLQLAMSVAGIWGLVIFLHALGQVQGFSAWMALLNAILIAIILVVAGYALAVLTNWLMFPGG